MECPNCESKSARVRFELSAYRIGRCQNCGLLYNIDFDTDSVTETFSEKYYLGVQKEAFRHVQEESTDTSVPMYRQGMEVVEKKSGVGSLLDVGCAFGSFLEFARKRGWSVKGIDVSPYSSRFARDIRGFDVITGTLPETMNSLPPFDLVTFWDVLEHVTKARENLRSAWALLKDGGHLVFTTPNYRSLVASIATMTYDLSAGTIRYPLERFFIPYNSCYFTWNDLRKILSKIGFNVVFLKKIDYPIDKIKLKPLEKALVQFFYQAGNLANLNTELMIVARKN